MVDHRPGLLCVYCEPEFKVLVCGAADEADAVKRWIAYEHDDVGGPTDSYVVAMAETREDAQRVMGEAIATRATAAVSRAMNLRIWAIFIEAPHELANDDARASPVTDPGTAVFQGFDEPEQTPGPAAPKTQNPVRDRRGRSGRRP